MPADAGPVFIGGLDRSGKTPLRRILEASTEIAFSRRMYLWTRVDGRYGDLADDASLSRCIDALRSHPRMGELQVDLDAVESELRAGRRTYPRLFDLIGSASARAGGKRRWGDQEGGVEERADAILGELADARMIHLLRDPRDRHVAVRAGRRRPGLLGISVARWQANARRAIANAEHHPDRYLLLRYEDLARSPRETALRLGKFIDVPELSRVAEAAIAWATEAGVDDDARAIGRFAASMPASEQWFVQSRLQRELEALEYPILPLKLTLAERLRYAAVVWPLNRASRLDEGST